MRRHLWLVSTPCMAHSRTRPRLTSGGSFRAQRPSRCSAQRSAIKSRYSNTNHDRFVKAGCSGANRDQHRDRREFLSLTSVRGSIPAGARPSQASLPRHVSRRTAPASFANCVPTVIGASYADKNSSRGGAPLHPRSFSRLQCQIFSVGLARSSLLLGHLAS